MKKSKAITMLQQLRINEDCIYRDSELSSSVGGLKPRLRDFDPGMESGDDLEEEDFSL